MEFSWLTVAIPAAVALVVGLITNAVTRSTSKELNATTTFEVVTKQLFEMNAVLAKDVAKLKEEVAELRKERDQGVAENQKLRDEIEDCRESVAALEGVNSALAESLGKLFTAWPQGYTMPEITFDWRRYLPRQNTSW